MLFIIPFCVIKTNTISLQSLHYKRGCLITKENVLQLFWRELVENNQHKK